MSTTFEVQCRVLSFDELSKMSNVDLAERIGELRDVLSSIAEGGPNAPRAGGFGAIRAELLSYDELKDLLPQFVIECRNARDFWNYISGAFSSYAARSQYITAQLLPIERQFRPERTRPPGAPLPEVRYEYSPVRPLAMGTQKYVSDERITQLRRISSAEFDLRKLVRLCEEINLTYAEGALLATAMLIRAILDHVPPVFGTTGFTQVANNYAGTKSFREAMDHLDKSARKVADGHLHVQIRPKETLPEPQQVNFAAEVDVLLAEIVRILS